MDHGLDLASPAAWWRWARQWRQERLAGTTDRVAVLEHIHDGALPGARYAFMIVMACGIAMLGLLQNSVAVIIGAMLISPLMGPIVQLGMGLATFELRRIRESLVTLAAGVLLALAIAVLIVWMSPLKAATSEILARTEPTFFDLLVAVFSGLAGAYATVTRKGETIVGVAIATALMPPLAVVGYGIAVGNGSIAGGAAFLFMTNLLAIALSVTIVARLYGFGGDDTPKQSAWQALMVVGTFVLLSIPLGLALKRIALQSQTELAVRTTLEAKARELSGRVSVLRVESGREGVAVETVMLMPRYTAGIEAQLQRDLIARLARPVSVHVREVVTADDASVAQQQGTLAELRRSVTALQDAETLRSAHQRAVADQRAAIQASLLPYLGRLQRSADGAHWELWVAADAGLSLQRALRIETETNAARKQDAPALWVYPPLQALPAIALGAPNATTGGPDSFQGSALTAQAWALRRWRANVVDARLSTRDNGQADAWTAAVRDALAAQGLTLGKITRERQADARLQLQPATR